MEELKQWYTQGNSGGQQQHRRSWFNILEFITKERLSAKKYLNRFFKPRLSLLPFAGSIAIYIWHRMLYLRGLFGQ